MEVNRKSQAELTIKTKQNPQAGEYHPKSEKEVNLKTIYNHQGDKYFLNGQWIKKNLTNVTDQATDKAVFNESSYQLSNDHEVQMQNPQQEIKNIQVGYQHRDSLLKHSLNIKNVVNTAQQMIKRSSYVEVERINGQKGINPSLFTNGLVANPPTDSAAYKNESTMVTVQSEISGGNENFNYYAGLEAGMNINKHEADILQAQGSYYAALYPSGQISSISTKGASESFQKTPDEFIAYAKAGIGGEAVKSENIDLKMSIDGTVGIPGFVSGKVKVNPILKFLFGKNQVYLSSNNQAGMLNHPGYSLSSKSMREFFIQSFNALGLKINQFDLALYFEARKSVLEVSESAAVYTQKIKEDQTYERQSKMFQNVESYAGFNGSYQYDERLKINVNTGVNTNFNGGFRIEASVTAPLSN